MYSVGMVRPSLTINAISTVPLPSANISSVAAAARSRSSALYQSSGAFFAAISSSEYPLICEKALFQRSGFSQVLKPQDLKSCAFDQALPPLQKNTGEYTPRAGFEPAIPEGSVFETDALPDYATSAFKAIGKDQQIFLNIIGDMLGYGRLS